MLFSLIVTLGLIGIIVGLAYIFLTWNFDYWAKQGIKGPKPKLIYGNFPGLVNRKRNLSYDIQDIYKYIRILELIIQKYNEFYLKKFK